MARSSAAAVGGCWPRRARRGRRVRLGDARDRAERSGRSPAIAALALPAALPSRLAARVAVAVLTLAGLTLVDGRHERGGDPRRRRPGAERHLRRRAAVRPAGPPRAAHARAPRRLRVLPRDRRDGGQQAVPRGGDRGRRGRLARHDPAGAEHDRDGRARAARGPLADRARRRPRPTRSRPRGRGQPRDRGRRGGARGRRRAPVRGGSRLAELGSLRRQSRAGTRQAVWRPTTAASTSHPARRPCSRSRLRGAPSTGARRRSTPSPPITGSRRSTRPAPPAATGRCHRSAASRAASARGRLGEAGGEREGARRRPRHRRRPADGDRRDRRQGPPLPERRRDA